MALQVRVRHSLGERVVELPERGVSEPLVIGRGREATLQIPSVVVMPQHCAVFIHEGQWIIQPMGGETSLNGDKLAEPAVLQIGDNIRLGSGPGSPTLEIDPVGAAEGRSGPVAVTAASQPLPAAARPMSPGMGGPMPAPAPAPAPRRAPNRPPQMPAYADAPPPEQAPQQEPGDISEFDWSAQAAASTANPQSKLIARRKTNSTGPMVAAIVIGGVLIIGVVWYVVNRQNRPVPKPVVIEETIPAKPAPAGPVKLFDLNADQNAARQAHPQGTGGEQPAPPANSSPDAGSAGSSATPSGGPAMDRTAAPVQAAANASPAAEQLSGAPTTPASPPTASTSSDAAPAAVNADDPAWQEVESAHFNVRHQGLAIVRYDEYRRNNPGKNAALLDKYQDEAVNWLYWQRVAQLWAQEDDFNAQIKQKDMDLRNQPAGDFHNQLAKDRAELQNKLDSAKREMTDDLGYTSDVPPDIENPSKLAELSQHRDVEKFTKFQRRVLKYTRDNHGAVWWDGQ